MKCITLVISLYILIRRLSFSITKALPLYLVLQDYLFIPEHLTLGHSIVLDLLILGVGLSFCYYTKNCLLILYFDDIYLINM